LIAHFLSTSKDKVLAEIDQIVADARCGNTICERVKDMMHRLAFPGFCVLKYKLTSINGKVCGGNGDANVNSALVLDAPPEADLIYEFDHKAWAQEYQGNYPPAASASLASSSASIGSATPLPATGGLPFLTHVIVRTPAKYNSRTPLPSDQALLKHALVFAHGMFLGGKIHNKPVFPGNKICRPK